MVVLRLSSLESSYPLVPVFVLAAVAVVVVAAAPPASQTGIGHRSVRQVVGVVL